MTPPKLHLEQKEQERGGLKGLVEQLYPLLAVFFEKDLEDALAQDPDLAKVAYYQVHELGSDYEKEKAGIATQQILDEMSVREKSTLLLTQFFGDFFEDRAPLFTFEKVDSVKETYRRLGQEPSAFDLKEFDGVPHMLVASNLFKLSPSFFKNEQEPFPLAKASRLVMGKDLAPFALNMMKTEAELKGLKVRVFVPGETLSAPASDEIQVILAPSLGQMEEGTVDWDQVHFYAQIWKDTEVPAFGFTPDLLASVFVAQGLNPQEACEKAGLVNPSGEFLIALATAPHSTSDSASEAGAEHSSEPDTSDENLDLTL